MEHSALKKICSSLTVGGLDSHHLSCLEQDFIQSYRPSGVTLFARNIPDPQSLYLLPIIKELRECNIKQNLPFIIAIDQEGGTVARIKNLKADPGKSLFLGEGKSDSKTLAIIAKKAKEMGTVLLNCGFNVNFAPSVDITNSADPKECAINTRSYGMKEKEVILRAGAFLEGLQQTGLFGCLKHFPGLGGVQIDTHQDTAIAKYSLEELQNKHLKPFIALQKKASMILVSHAIYPNFSAKEATRCPQIMTELLRKKMNFKGLIVSDDLQMHAVSHSKLKWEEYILESISAGCDLLLICKGLEPWKKACDLILLEAQKYPSFKKRVLEAYERIQSFRQKLSSC